MRRRGYNNGRPVVFRVEKPIVDANGRIVGFQNGAQTVLVSGRG